MLDAERFQEINRMYAANGIPVMMPEDWPMMDALANASCQTSFIRLSKLDSNPLARAVASEMVQYSVNHDIPIDFRWHPEYDETNPLTTRLSALVFGDTDERYIVRVPLMFVHQWKLVASDYLDNNPRPHCDVHNQLDCNYFDDNVVIDLEVKSYPVKRGETICIFKCCDGCRQRMNNHSFTDDDYVQAGALPWYDDGSRDNDDPWS